VAGFHAGWRGTVQHIVELGVGRLRTECNSDPRDLIAAIGPGVGPCCYSVGDEVIGEFTSQFAYAAELFHEVDAADPECALGHAPHGRSIHLDLIEANRRQLLDAGLKPRAITVVGGCTNCRTDLFFSHRASQGHAGRMMALIAIAAQA
jgi:YfiH family protein